MPRNVSLSSDDAPRENFPERVRYSSHRPPSQEAREGERERERFYEVALRKFSEGDDGMHCEWPFGK